MVVEKGREGQFIRSLEGKQLRYSVINKAIYLFVQQTGPLHVR